MGVRYKEKENKPESLIRNSITISKVLYAVLHYSKFALSFTLLIIKFYFWTLYVQMVSGCM